MNIDFWLRIENKIDFYSYESWVILEDSFSGYIGDNPERLEGLVTQVTPEFMSDVRAYHGPSLYITGVEEQGTMKKFTTEQKVTFERIDDEEDDEGCFFVSLRLVGDDSGSIQ